MRILTVPGNANTIQLTVDCTSHCWHKSIITASQTHFPSSVNWAGNVRLLIVIVRLLKLIVYVCFISRLNFWNPLGDYNSCRTLFIPLFLHIFVLFRFWDICITKLEMWVEENHSKDEKTFTKQLLLLLTSWRYSTWCVNILRVWYIMTLGCVAVVNEHNHHTNINTLWINRWSALCGGWDSSTLVTLSITMQCSAYCLVSPNLVNRWTALCAAEVVQLQGSVDWDL